MFKDYDKYLITSLKVYLFVLLFVFILKIVGLDYFGLDINNPIMIKLSNFCINWKLDIIWSYIVCFISSYIVVSISLKDNSKKILKLMIIVFPITILVKYSGYILSVVPYYLLQLLYLIIIFIIYEKKVNKDTIIRYFKISILILIFQLLSTVIRNQSFDYTHYNFLISFLINIDQLLLSIIYHKVYFMKGGSICYQEEEVGSYLRKKLNLKKSLQKLQKNYQNNKKKFKKKNKEEKLTIVLYIIFSLIWNTLSVALILFVSFLNDTFIECIFILTSFWLSKGKFGKPFHFDSMFTCFIVSNLSYYTLNSITTPLGISILIPILLGVGLSYFTSKFVKKKYDNLYRGMPIDTFEETILKVMDKDCIKYNICYDFYINKISDLSLSFKYNYSVSGIRKIRDRVNQRIKKLN